MQSLPDTDRHFSGRPHPAAGLLCAAAGGLIALYAPHIPVLVGNAAVLSSEFIYGRHISDSQTASAETTAAAYAASLNTRSIPDFDDTAMLSYGYAAVPSAENEDPVFIESEPADSGLITEPTPAGTGGKITDTFYGTYSGDDYIDLPHGGQVRNVTSISNTELLGLAEVSPAFGIKADGSPEVLIIHTHTTESYEKSDSDRYDSSSTCRTADETENVCAVGHEIALKLKENGIGVIHDTTIHDYPSYNGSYDRSRITAEKILAEYPTVKTVLDIHRDAIEHDGERIAPTAVINGRNAAQIMIICGCGTSSQSIPGFRSNFSYACRLQSTIENEFPTLTRPVLFDYRFYNQDMTYGSLLIEIGGHANTLDEAVYSGQLVGQALADTLLTLKK